MFLMIWPYVGLFINPLVNTIKKSVLHQTSFNIIATRSNHDTGGRVSAGSIRLLTASAGPRW